MKIYQREKQKFIFILKLVKNWAEDSLQWYNFIIWTNS